MQSTATDRAMKPLRPRQAAEAMWNFYREHKALLIADIIANRSSILAELIRGVPVANVFAPFFHPPEPATPVRHARQVRKSTSQVDAREVTMTAIYSSRS